MAIATTMEIIDFLDNTGRDYSIHATSKGLADITLISSDDAYRYIIRKYGDRRYTLLSGVRPHNKVEMNVEFHNDYRLWLLNRRRNIDRMYQTLYDYDYVPIENYNRTESETIQSEDSVEYGHIISDSGSETVEYGKTDTLSGTDTTTYGKTDSRTGSDTITTNESIENDKTDTDTINATNTKNGREINTTEKAGFNAPYAYTPDVKTTLEYDNVIDDKVSTDSRVINDDTTRTETETTQHNTVDTLGGNDRVTYGKTNTTSGSDETEKTNVSEHSGTDIDTKDSERNMHAYGNIGVTTNQKMVTEEMEVRKVALVEMLIDNFINDFTFYS